MSLIALYLLSCIAFTAFMLDDAGLRDRLLMIGVALVWPLAVVAALVLRVQRSRAGLTPPPLPNP